LGSFVRRFRKSARPLLSENLTSFQSVSKDSAQGDALLSAAMGRSSSHLLVVHLLFVVALTAGTLSPSALAQNRKTKTTRPAPRNLNYPKIRAAISSLEAARAELERSDGDFGGHKKDAVDSIDRALKQMRLALQFEKY
jgi:hypothetical protein